MSSQTFAKKTQKSFIRLLAPLKIYLFIWRCINSFYMRIHEVAGDRALLPVEEHVGADAVVADTRQTAISQRLSIDVHADGYDRAVFLIFRLY